MNRMWIFAVLFLSIFMIQLDAHDSHCGQSNTCLLSPPKYKSTVLQTAASVNAEPKSTLVTDEQKNDNAVQQKADTRDFWDRYPRLTAVSDFIVLVTLMESVKHYYYVRKPTPSLVTNVCRVLYGLAGLRVLLGRL
ncbi:MAG TPA: hypothetical protein VGT41_05915 [Candidatus Babeliales bacterium]|nr:hypothetical protein [Candidatus Babeliales bacterium]